MKKKLIAIIVVVMMIALAIAGCGGSGGGSSSGGGGASGGPTLDNPDRTYYYCGQLNAHPYFNDVYLGVKWAANQLNCTIIKVGPDTFDPVAQSEAIEQCIAKNPDGIMTPLYDPAPLPAIAKAMDAGIPVVVFEADLEGDNGAMAYVGSDNFAYGEQLADELLKVAPGGKLAAVGNWGATNTDQNWDGFVAGIEGSGWEVAGKYDDQVNAEGAIAAAKDAINNNPDVTALLGFDSSAGGGIVQALKELGKGPGEYIIVCKDREDAILEGVAEGYISAAIINKSAAMAYQAVLLLHAYNNFGMDNVPVTTDNRAAGVSPMAQNNFVGQAVITKDNVDYFLSDNMPDIQSDLFKQ